MKIITDNAIYVQKNDMVFLNQTDLSIPVSIFMEVFGKGVTVINDSNRYEFIKFEEKEEIDFFKEMDWIIDYNLLKDLTEEEIITLGQETIYKKNEIAKKFNELSMAERKNNMHMVEESERLDFKIYSLRDLLWFKQGHLSFDLPEGVDYPKDYKVKESVIKKLLRKLKK